MNTSLKSSRSNQTKAFTLVEILVVLVIIGIIAAFAGPAMNAILKSSKMTTAADQLVRELSLARQVAVRDNSPVEFRIFFTSDPTQPGDEEAYRAYQASRKIYDPVDPASYTVEPVGKLIMLPDATEFAEDPTFSTLLTDTGMIRGTVKNDEGESQAIIGKNYISFLFNTDGSTSLVKIDPRKLWYFTVVRETDELSGSEPEEYATIQINPFTGKTQRYEK